MLIVYRKSGGKVASNSGTNSYLPDGPAFGAEVQNAIVKLGGTDTDYAEYRLNDQADAALVQQILNSGSYELTFDAQGKPTGVVTYARIAVTADKSQILANGVDAATITAQVADTASTESLAFVIDGDEAGAVPVQSAAGKATLIYKTTKFGRHIIEVRSSTKYGRNMVEVTAT